MESTSGTSTEQETLASRHAFWLAHDRYIADAQAAADPRERLFAILTPWIDSQTKRYGRLWDGSIQFKGEETFQTLRLLLWESIIEWDQERARSATFRSNPTGVVIRKTQAKIRCWYQQERQRYWLMQALIQDYNDEWTTLAEYVGGWRREAEEGATAKERRYARTVVKILSTIGAGDGQRRLRRAELDPVFQRPRETAPTADPEWLRVAVRQGVLTENEAELLATERIREPNRRVHNRLRQRRHRARLRYEKWVVSDEAQAVLVREGLLNVEGLCCLLALVSHFPRQIPQNEVDELREWVMSLPGAKEMWDRMDTQGRLPEDIEYHGSAPGYFTWEDVGFPEGDED